MLKSILSTVLVYEIYQGTQNKKHIQKKKDVREAHTLCKVLSFVFVYELK